MIWRLWERFKFEVLCLVTMTAAGVAMATFVRGVLRNQEKAPSIDWTECGPVLCWPFYEGTELQIHWHVDPGEAEEEEDGGGGEEEGPGSQDEELEIEVDAGDGVPIPYRPPEVGEA